MTSQNQYSFDVLVIGDARFSGGSTGALVADVSAFSEMGLSIGLLFVRSAYLDDTRDPVNPAASALLDLPGVTGLSNGTQARAKIAFLHHPMVFYRGIEERAVLSAERSYIVTHHAPFRADGSVEFDPSRTLKNVAAALELRAAFAPISGIVRRQLASFAPFIALAAEDWPNVFDSKVWPATSPLLAEEVLTIGRHGRPDLLKWPATPRAVASSLPQSDATRVRVLGCPAQALQDMGVDLQNWDIITFGAEPVVDFLNSLDVFVYHFSHRWIETFGRTIAEAMFCGRICLLDPRLEPTFGDKARYCRPDQVADVLQEIRKDPQAARAFAQKSQEAAIRDYGQASVAQRLEKFIQQTPTRARAHASHSPVQTFRKLIGHHRRRAAGATG